MDLTNPVAALAEGRAEIRARIVRLQHEVAEIIAASGASNADDEHDPEGATIAFEREQVSSLVAAARVRLEEFDAAFARVEGGIYGRCAECGSAIGAERLAARPSAARCIDCERG